MQLSLTNNDWFNLLNPFEQAKTLIDHFNVKERLKHKNQKDRVLWHLMEFGQITNLQCHEFYSIRHCPSVIRDLRKDFAKEGKYRIVNEHHKDGVDKFGCKCTFDIYKLEEIPEWEKYYEKV